MSDKNRRSVYLLILSALLLSSITTPLSTQNQSPIQQAVSTLEQYAGKFKKSVSKVILCIHGDAQCTKTEIDEARTIIGIIGAALTTLAVGGGFAVAKYKGWRPFSKKATPQPPIQPEVVPPAIPIDASSPLYAQIKTLKSYLDSDVNRDKVAHDINELHRQFYKQKPQEEVNTYLSYSIEDMTLRDIIKQLETKYTLRRMGSGEWFPSKNKRE
jgi:hypothetical protein